MTSSYVKQAHHLYCAKQVGGVIGLHIGWGELGAQHAHVMVHLTKLVPHMTKPAVKQSPGQGALSVRVGSRNRAFTEEYRKERKNSLGNQARGPTC